MSYLGNDQLTLGVTGVSEERGHMPSLADCMRSSLEAYFSDLDGQAVTGVYEMVINEVERPLLKTVLERTRGNQSEAARVLGINRATLRKKLRHHGLS